jgi:hypothetical protein
MMSFDIQQPVFDPDGEYLEDAAIRYRELLMEGFEASAEGQNLVHQGGSVGWGETFMEPGMGYLEVTPAAMTAEQVQTLLFELFPRKVSAEPGCGQEIVTELQAFWKFLRREFGLRNADACLRVLTPATARRLEREMHNPANFGLAKAFPAQGREYGFDMATPEGMQAWAETYNAGHVWTQNGRWRCRVPAQRVVRAGQPRLAASSRSVVDKPIARSAECHARADVCEVSGVAAVSTLLAQCMGSCRCGRSGEAGGPKDLVQVDADLGHEFGDQLGARAARVSRDQQPMAIDERALLDQVDDPDFVQIVTQVVVELRAEVTPSGCLRHLDDELYLRGGWLERCAVLEDRDIGLGLAIAGQDDGCLAGCPLPAETVEEQRGQVAHRTDVRFVHRRHFDDLPMQQFEAAIAEDAGVDGAVILLKRPVVGLGRNQLARLVAGGHETVQLKCIVRGSVGRRTGELCKDWRTLRDPTCCGYVLVVHHILWKTGIEG